MRAVLQQYIHGQWCPLAYFSKVLKPAETCYITFDHELLAIYLAVKPFRYFIKGHSFLIFTAIDICTCIQVLPREMIHLNLISQFTSDIHNVKGSHNLPSRCSESPPVIDFQAMAIAQNSDPDLQHLRTDSSLMLQAVPLAMSDSIIICNVSTGFFRLYVPKEFSRTELNSLHRLSHSGICAT